MNYEEALEWLRGERSMHNALSDCPPAMWAAATAVADASKTQQAYFIVKAWHEFPEALAAGRG